MPLYATMMPGVRRGTKRYAAAVEYYLSILPEGSFIYNPGFCTTLEGLDTKPYKRDRHYKDPDLGKILNRGVTSTTFALSATNPLREGTATGLSKPTDL